MPQMSPMNWILLFMFFNVSLYFTLCKLNSVPSIEMSHSLSKSVKEFKIYIA